MTKLHYKDQLQAAWMAREFGVEYDGLDHTWDDLLFDALAHNMPSPDEYIVSPASLPIFEPQEGDVIIECGGDLDKGYVMSLLDKQPDGITFTFHFGDEIMLEVPEDDWVIIQRNGKAFFMPEKG